MPMAETMREQSSNMPLTTGSDVGYKYATVNEHMLGAGEPLRVKQGERVLMRLLNASATENVVLALPGHRFTVIAMDGNPVPESKSVEVLSLAVAERVDAIVEMNAPGVWILGSTLEKARKMGLGIVVEYAGQKRHAGVERSCAREMGLYAVRACGYCGSSRRELCTYVSRYRSAEGIEIRHVDHQQQVLAPTQNR